jgi:hypothetical protein
MLAGETKLIFVAFMPPNVTLSLPSKFVPVMVTRVPSLPFNGETVVIVGFA